MRRLRSFVFRLAGLFGFVRRENDIAEELRTHRDAMEAEFRRGGMSDDEARRAAAVKFGSLASASEAYRDARGITFIETVARDVLFAFRSFRRTPTVTVLVIGTIGLALGLNAAVFTVFNAYVFRSDVVRDPNALFSVRWLTGTSETRRFTFREYETFRQENDVFSDVAARRMEVTTRVEGRLAEGQLVTGNFFQTLGVSPAFGRVLTPADATSPGREAVVVLSHLGWQRLYGGDSSVVGRTIRLNGFNCTVVGITPKGFLGLDLFPADFWAPLTLAAEIQRRSWESPDNPTSLDLVGRLKSGITEARARTKLERAGLNVRLSPSGTATPFSADALLAFSPLFIAFGLTLVIACANVANLMLARAFARQREIGIRLSLGASRRRIIRQLLTESLLVALAAAGCGLLISRVVVDSGMLLLFATMPVELTELLRLAPLPTDFRIAGFLVVAALISAALFGLLPALRATRLNLVRAAHGELGRDARPGRTRGTLIVIQVTASALLLITASIALRSALRAASTDPGIRVSDTIIINLTENSPTAAIVAAVESDPRVSALAAVWPGVPVESLPRAAFASTTSDGGEQPTSYRFVSPEYFAVFGVDLVYGRSFTREEAATRAAVAVVSESAARLFWPAENPLGKTLRVTTNNASPRRNEIALPSAVVVVIGVARDITGYSLAGEDRNRTPIYLPIPSSDAATNLIVRVHGDPELARLALVENLTRIAPELQSILKMSTFGALATYPLTVAFWLTVALGTLALALTLSGIYGVLSYLVVQRTRELGLRIALGATTSSVTRLVLWQSLRLVSIGLAIGGSMALIVSILFAKMPIGDQLQRLINPLDPVAYLASLGSIIAACVLAALVPAFRAARIDPITTLRHD